MSNEKPTMMTYINQEQDVLADILNEYPNGISTVKGKQWLILATGSSFNAAYTAKYYIENLLGVFISIEEPFKFHYYEKLRPEIDAIIGVSQSGESTSTIDALKKINEERSTISSYALTSNLNSEITTEVNDVIDISNGEEKVGYVTKGYTATVLKLMLMGLKTARSREEISEADEHGQLKLLQENIDKIPQIIEKTEIFFDKWKKELIQASRYTALCCGSAIGSALEMQTKFNETVRVPSQGMDIEVFMHGPYLEVNPKHQMFFIESNSPVNDRLIRLRDYEDQYVDHLYTISINQSDDEKTIGLDLTADEFMAPLFITTVFQVLAHHIAEELGNNLPQRIYTDFGVAMQSKTKPGDYV